jgi:hypothetical protein
MDTCLKCGAGLSPNVDWCLRCYRPVLRLGAADADRPEFPDDVRYVLAPHPKRAVLVPEAGTGIGNARSGSANLGFIVRLLITAVVVALGLGVRALTLASANALGSMALSFGAVFLGVWSILGGLVLWSTWRPDRRTRILRVEGEILSVTPARRRADDPRVPAR